MANQAIEGFYQKVMSDPSLQEQFKGAADEQAFVNLAVKLGAQHGYSFTAEDVRARMKQGGAGGGELSDKELETVVGGYVSLGNSTLCGYCGSQSGTSRGTYQTS